VVARSLSVSRSTSKALRRSRSSSTVSRSGSKVAKPARFSRSATCQWRGL